MAITDSEMIDAMGSGKVKCEFHLTFPDRTTWVMRGVLASIGGTEVAAVVTGTQPREPVELGLLMDSPAEIVEPLTQADIAELSHNGRHKRR